MIKKAVTRIKRDNENGARKAVLEDLFYDFNKDRKDVYLFNFIRGVFFGIGSVLGGTIFVAFIVWILHFLVDIPGGIGDFVQYVVNIVQNARK